MSTVITRGTLIAQLDRARKRSQALWIAAPAGAGKTTLTAAYLRSRRLKHLWYQVDARDADLATFFYFVREGVASNYSRARRLLPLLTPEYALGLNVFARNFFERLSGLFKPPFVLVFDNYQEIQDDTSLHAILAQALSMLLDVATVIFLSRNDPPPAYANLQAQRRLAVVDADAFMLSVSEIRRLARRYRFRSLTNAALANLHTRTRGWMAGVVLMLEQAARDHAAAPQFDQPEVHTIFDFFASEVFQRLPAEYRAVLMKTALLPQISADAAQALTDEKQAEGILSELARQHFFVNRLAGAERVYQYHPLLREFLDAQLRHKYPADELNALRRQAAELADATGDYKEAVALWRDAGAWNELAHYLARIGETLLQQARGQTLAGWIAAVPAAVREQDPWLLYWLGQCLLPYDPARARIQFERAYGLFRERAQPIGSLLAWAGIVDGALHLGRDLGALDHWIAEISRIQGSEPVPAEVGDQVSVRMFSALTMRQPQHPDIGIWAERAQTILQSGNNLQLRLSAGVHLCVYSSWLGDGGRAQQSLHWLSSLGHTSELPPLMWLLVQDTEALYAWMVEADAPRVLRIVDEAHAYGERVGVYVWDHHFAGHGAAAALESGDMTTARKMLARMARQLDRARLLDVGYYHYLANWEALMRGDLATAEAHMHATEGLRAPLGLAFGEALWLLMAVRTHIAQGRYDPVRPLLDDLHGFVRATHSHWLGYAAAMEEAMLALRVGDQAQLRRWLIHGFGLGRAHDLANFHGWRPEIMAELCANALDRDIETGYVRALVRRRALPLPKGAVPETWPCPIRLYTLGRFSLIKDEKPLLVTSGKGHKKPLELLKTLIALGGRQVGADKLVDALWPSADGDAAMGLLKVTLHRLRQLLGSDTAVEFAEGRLTLNSKEVWVDAWMLARLLGDGEAMIASAACDTHAVADAVGHALRLYRGHFLDNEPEINIAILRQRERLRARILNVIKHNLALLERAADWPQLERDSERAIGIDEIDEDLHLYLMRSFLAQNKPAQVLAAYERARRVYSMLNLKLSQRFEILRIQAQRAG